MQGLFGETAVSKYMSENGDKCEINASPELPIEQLHPSPKNHFRVEMDEAMDELIASIKLKGILVPLIVRPRIGGGYEIMSGHRRHFAAARAGRTTVPVVIMDVSDEDRDIIIADTNLQRPNIRISEKAWAIRLKYDAIKRKTNGESLNGILGAPGAPKMKSVEIIAEKMGLAENTIKRYIRLTYLIDTLLDMVDENILPLKAGVQLSYLSEPVQRHVSDVMYAETIKINEEKAKQLRETLSETATVDDVFRELKPEKAISKPKGTETKIILTDKIVNIVNSFPGQKKNKKALSEYVENVLTICFEETDLLEQIKKKLTERGYMIYEDSEQEE